ncbi:hypothetical protein Rhopal_001796-T1 [Rhodotorula paludigena]|uniref:JmjC domain-containing protein n=1 Tax=Rhodotorula paludigena TaxID=86838 RepID=A0AAV5GGE1_9BASI|nr:hypothetical protein Rhopal_001796-T1 [Rhodotorula paludigena]
MPLDSAGPSASAVARLSATQCSYVYFREHHLLPNSPCLFPQDLVKNWALLRRWFLDGAGARQIDWDYLRDQYGSLELSCLELGERAVESAPRTFGALCDLWQSGAGRSKYLKDWHLPLRVHEAAEQRGQGKGKERVRDELYEVPEYAGGGDTFTPLHRDVYCSYSISTQIYGSKRWYLFPPSCTPALRALLVEAERSDTCVNCDEWPDDRQDDFRRQGMMVVEQNAGETIFIPSGYYHSVHNLAHPTFSLNHNWLNSHILPSVYRALSNEVARCRDAISDVKEMLQRQAVQDGASEEGWRKEWEQTVDGLVERSEGWSWPTFWRMTLHTLRNLDVPLAELEQRAALSRWPVIPPSARPPTLFVVEQVRSLLQDFLQRLEQEWKWLPGLQDVVQQVEVELQRLS